MVVVQLDLTIALLIEIGVACNKYLSTSLSSYVARLKVHPFVSSTKSTPSFENVWQLFIYMYT